MRSGWPEQSILEIPFATRRRALDIFASAVQLDVVLERVAIDVAVVATRTGWLAAVRIVATPRPDLIDIPSSAGRAGRILGLVAVAARFELFITVISLVEADASVLIVRVPPSVLVPLSSPLRLIAAVAGTLSLHLRLDAITMIVLLTSALDSLIVPSRRLPSLSVVIVFSRGRSVIEVAQVILE
jgi:hypothetical protein